MTTTIARTPKILLRRWPTLLAVALVAVVFMTDTAGLASTLMLLPTVYVLALALGRRWTWPVVLVGMAAGVVLGALDVDQRTLLLVVAAAGVGAAIVHGRGRREVALQAAGLLVFGGAAFMAATVSAPVAAWLVAAAWFAHGVWDFVHLYRDAVVSRSFAEWCGVIDVLVAAALVLTATSWAP